MAVLSDLIHVGIGKETTPGTAVSVQNGHWASWNAFSIDFEGDTKIANTGALGTRYATKAIKNGIRNHKVTIEGALTWRLGAVLLYAYNTDLTTQNDTPETGIYTHTLNNSNVTNTYSIVVLDDIVGNRVYPYGVLDSLKISGSANELVTFSADFFARKYESASNSVAYDSADNVFASPEVCIQINGQDYTITNFTLELNENAIITNGVCSDTFVAGAKGKREEKLSLTIVAENNILETLFNNNTDVTASLTLTDNAKTIGASTHPQIKFDWNKAKITSIKEGINMGELVTYEIELTPIVDPATITIINDWDNTEMNK